MSEAEYQINRTIDRHINVFDSFTPGEKVDCRSILHLFSTSELKRVAIGLYDKGLRGEAAFEKMVVDIMNNAYELSEKQRNALITFIMYAR